VFLRDGQPLPLAAKTFDTLLACWKIAVRLLRKMGDATDLDCAPLEFFKLSRAKQVYNVVL
jgi:hypothetical protein